MAVAALRVMGYDVQGAAGRFAAGGHSPLATLLAFQEPGGAFAYIREPGREEIRIAATTDALTALAPRQTARSTCALRYLPVRIVR